MPKRPTEAPKTPAPARPKGNPRDVSFLSHKGDVKFTAYDGK